MKFFLSIVSFLCLASVAQAAESQIWGTQLLPNILNYGRGESINWGMIFTMLQVGYLKTIFLTVVIAVPSIFLGHYLIIGPKVFSHDGEKIFVFTLFQRVIHLLAAVAFIILVPTGLMIIFGKYLGGGTLIELARHMHGIATIIFLISVFPMFLFWFIEMLPSLDDIKWCFILGGYLSKNIKEIPAGKFNAGQKMWFWMSSLGGMVMIASGLAMFYQNFDYGIAATFGLSQIDFLRICAMLHSGLALLITAFFFTHAYMSLFAIKGAIHSIITGYKEHDEVMYLHSSFYKKLKKAGKI